MSVFKRPGSPFYYAEFQIGGQRFLRSTRRKTEREARSEERKIKEAERAKLKEAAGRDQLTLDQGFERYWQEHGQRLSWASEVERYIHQILARVDPGILIENLGDSDVNDFVQVRVNEGGGEYAINR